MADKEAVYTLWQQLVTEAKPSKLVKVIEGLSLSTAKKYSANIQKPPTWIQKLMIDKLK